MTEKIAKEVQDAVPDTRRERRLFTSQMLGFVIIPCVGMALLGVVIFIMEKF